MIRNIMLSQLKRQWNSAIRLSSTINRQPAVFLFFSGEFSREHREPSDPVAERVKASKEKKELKMPLFVLERRSAVAKARVTGEAHIGR